MIARKKLKGKKKDKNERKSTVIMLKLSNIPTNKSNRLCHSTKHERILVLKYCSAQQSKLNNQIIVCLSNMKAALSTNILQLEDKMLENKYCKMVFMQPTMTKYFGRFIFNKKLFKSEIIRHAKTGLIYTIFVSPTND